MAVTTALSPSRFPESSTGRLEVSSVLECRMTEGRVRFDLAEARDEPTVRLTRHR